MNPVMIDPVEEQPDVDIQHEDYPLNVLDLADEPPILDMDIVDDHQVVEQENLLLKQKATAYLVLRKPIENSGGAVLNSLHLE